MITLKEIVLGKDGRPIDAVYDKGVHHLSLEERPLFDLLRIKEQGLPKGQFIIDDCDVFTSREFGRMPFLLEIKSAVFFAGCVFIVDFEHKRAFKKKLLGELGTLRSLPLENEDDELAKIRKIIEVVSENGLSYLLVDMNGEVNGGHAQLIDKALEEAQENVTAIILDPPGKAPEKPARTETPAELEKTMNLEKIVTSVEIDTAKGEMTKAKPEKKRLGKGKFSSAFLKKAFKHDVTSIILSVVFAISLVFVMEICVTFLVGSSIKGNNVVGGIILLLVTLVGIGCDVYLTIFAYQETEKLIQTKADYWSYVGVFLGVSLLGGLLGIAGFYLLAHFGFIFQDITSWGEPLGGAIVIIVILIFQCITNYLSAGLKKAGKLIRKNKK